MPKTTFPQRVRIALDDHKKTYAVALGARHLVEGRARALAAFPQMDEFRNRARRIRAHTLSRLDTYLAEFADNVAANGGTVFWAKDAAEATQYVRQLAREKGVRRAVKSKSMVTEEIHLNRELEKDGITVTESDLGEFIIQLAEETPSHIIAPVMHKTRYEVAETFRDKLGVPYTDDPIELNHIAREYLRKIFLSADMGISGVNFGVAESGSICLVTNEGNGRLTTTAPRIHVAIMGMEKIVPTFEDLGVMLNVLARSATGQKLSVYTNIITGARRPTDPDGPEEFHVVILDNGRSRALASENAEILYCIRCGACLNHCPVFQAIGGHAYGSVYPGPIGSVLSPIFWGTDAAGDLPHACTLCGKCREVCPVRIDLPRMLLNLRATGLAEKPAPAWLRWGIRQYRAAAVNPQRFQGGIKVSATGLRLLAKNGWVKKLPAPLNGWTDHRELPTFAPKSFHQLWKERNADTD